MVVDRLAFCLFVVVAHTLDSFSPGVKLSTRLHPSSRCDDYSELLRSSGCWPHCLTSSSTPTGVRSWPALRCRPSPHSWNWSNESVQGVGGVATRRTVHPSSLPQCVHCRIVLPSVAASSSSVCYVRGRFLGFCKCKPRLHQSVGAQRNFAQGFHQRGCRGVGLANCSCRSRVHRRHKRSTSALCLARKRIAWSRPCTQHVSQFFSKRRCVLHSSTPGTGQTFQHNGSGPKVSQP